MSGESVCRVARSWVDVGIFHTRLVVRFMVFTASVRNILVVLSYVGRFEMWFWTGVEKISWVDRVSNEGVLQGVMEEMNIVRSLFGK
jgi:hypothetical protein